MSVNSASSSSSSNDSLLHSYLSATNSSLPFDVYCLTTGLSPFILTTFSITIVLLLLPLCILVLYLGLQRWQQQRTTSTAATMSHSDSFTYHMVTMELIATSGFLVFSCGMHTGHIDLITVGIYIWSFIWSGQMFFHNLTCLERYLAVVHPIIYLGLRGEGGVRIRNISIGCVWLLSIGGPSTMTSHIYYIVCFCLLIFSLIVMIFCSISVLCVLTRPGPGEQCGGRQQVDISKQRAFYTILAILGVLLIRCVWNLYWLILNLSGVSMDCVVALCGTWVNLPCSLVLPLLFLHRAGRLACCKSNTKWG